MLYLLSFTMIQRSIMPNEVTKVTVKGKNSPSAKPKPYLLLIPHKQYIHTLIKNHNKERIQQANAAHNGKRNMLR